MTLPASNLSGNVTYALQGISVMNLVCAIQCIYSVNKSFKTRLGNKWYTKEGSKPAILAIIMWICTCIGLIVLIVSINDLIVSYSSDNYEKDCSNGINCTACVVLQHAANILGVIVASISYIVELQTLLGALKATSVKDNTKKIVDIIQIAVVINGILLIYIVTFNIAEKQIFELKDNIYVCLDSYDRTSTLYLSLTASVSMISMGIGISMSVLFVSKLRKVYVEYHKLTVGASINMLELSKSVTDVVLVKQKRSKRGKNSKNQTDENDKSKDKLQGIVCREQDSESSSSSCSQDDNPNCKTNIIKMRIKFGPVHISTSDINLAQNKQLQSILNLMARYTVIVITYVIIRVLIGNISNTVLKFPSITYSFVFSTFAATTWIYFLFPSGVRMYGKLCYCPHKCVILCLLNSTSRQVQSEKTVSGVELQTLKQKVLQKSKIDHDNQETWSQKSTASVCQTEVQSNPTTLQRIENS